MSNNLENDHETYNLPQKWIHDARKPRSSGLTKGFAANRSEAIARTKTVGGHIGFISNRPPEGSLMVFVFLF